MQPPDGNQAPPSPCNVQGGRNDGSCSHAVHSQNLGRDSAGQRSGGGTSDGRRNCRRADRSVRVRARGAAAGRDDFEDTHSVTGALTTPKQSAEYLYLASKGENLSGRSTNIQGAFASVAGRIRRQRRRRGHGLDRRKSKQHQSGGDRSSSSPRPPGSRTSPITEPSRHRSRCTSIFRPCKSG